MKPAPARGRAEGESLQRQGERLFSEWAASAGFRLRAAPSLVLYNPSAPCPDLRAISEGGGEVSLRLTAHRAQADLEWGGIPVTRTSAQSLPLQTASFGAVALCHLLARGEEPELSEACRVLQPGGRLFILGLNHLGLRYLGIRSSRAIPGLKPLAVRARLEALEMNVLGLYAAGFMRGERPRRMNRGAARILIPLADLFLIVAKPVEPKIMNPLAKSRLRTVGVPSALAGR